MSTNPLPPDLQNTLERLFEMFSAYVAAGTDRERREIHAQILDLFSRLGVVSDSALVRRATEIFDRIKQEPTAPLLREATLANDARDLVTARVRIFERTSALKLSAGARQLVRMPIVEAAEFGLEFDPEQSSQSLDRVFRSLTESPLTPAEGTDKVRTSIAVIRAFWKNFCRIPPFCSGGDRNER